MQSSWPRPHYDETKQPHFLFIITPPYSGSTCLAKLINTSPKTTLLDPSGEAQWLIPGLCGPQRWRADLPVDFESVKAVWLNMYQRLERASGGKAIVIEKSPPNMMRMEKICNLFSDYSLLANNRNPYAFCSSALYRNHPVHEISVEERVRRLENLARTWLERSRKVRDLTTQLNAPLVTYEQFCAEPRSLVRKLRLDHRIANTIQFDDPIKVKDYAPQQIVNQNPRQIGLLSPDEIEAISHQLSTDLDLLAFYDYELIAPAKSRAINKEPSASAISCQ
ncbi:MAG: sulfotransferase [Halioglobus sp.]|nr:sulfotransferase [Halioglobus sp.]